MFLGLWNYDPKNPWRKPEDCGYDGMTHDFAKHSETGDLDEENANLKAMYEEIADVEVLLAYYDYEDYTGLAFVLFRKDGKLYEVNGSHCSCYGLAGQWEPEETTVEALYHRLAEGSLGRSCEHKGGEKVYTNLFARELRGVLRGLD